MLKVPDLIECESWCIMYDYMNKKCPSSFTDFFTHFRGENRSKNIILEVLLNNHQPIFQHTLYQRYGIIQTFPIKDQNPFLYLKRTFSFKILIKEKNIVYYSRVHLPHLTNTNTNSTVFNFQPDVISVCMPTFYGIWL